MRNAASLLTTLEGSSLDQFESVSGGVFDDAAVTFPGWTELDTAFTDFVVATHTADIEVDHVLGYDRHDDAFDATTLRYGRRE